MGSAAAVTFLLFLSWLLTGYDPLAPFAALALLFTASFAWFFRDPERWRRADSALVMSPADGRVMAVHRAGRSRVIEIFMAVWNVHVQRAPVSGRVVSRRYHRGAYLAAFNPLAAMRNTRCDTVFKCAAGTVGMVQIAGLVARKVECWLKPGQAVGQGQRMGIIHFGSQVRVAVSGKARILVRPGMIVKAGLTPIAKWPPPVRA